MPDPMTLTEFEREANNLVWIKAHEAFGASGVAFVNLRPLLLRLLAGERERCAQVLAKAAEDAYAEAALLRRQHLPNTHMDERGSTLDFAERLIRSMEDPT